MGREAGAERLGPRGWAHGSVGLAQRLDDLAYGLRALPLGLGGLAQGLGGSGLEAEIWRSGLEARAGGRFLVAGALKAGLGVGARGLGCGGRGLGAGA